MDVEGSSALMDGCETSCSGRGEREEEELEGVLFKRDCGRRYKVSACRSDSELRMRCVDVDWLRLWLYCIAVHAGVCVCVCADASFSVSPQHVYIYMCGLSLHMWTCVCV